jgi:nucleoside-diphosphate-sugar epimerase
MFEHSNTAPIAPARVVVVGAGGFVGSAVADRLEAYRVPVVRVGRTDVDFAQPGAEAKLAAILRTGDAVVASAARAPCKDAELLLENMLIVRGLVRALARVPVSHIVNISSDAVYADLHEPLSESSCAAPGTLHGAMHLAREAALRGELKVPLAILRPSLLYGASDPHNGYGPNRFRRQAAGGETIMLFGEGEERRDHVYIDDAAELVCRVLFRRSIGVLNIATGAVHSFREIAEKVVALSGRRVPIQGSPRTGPMPHNGYRSFDTLQCRSAFADFRYTSLDEGLARAQREMEEVG